MIILFAKTSGAHLNPTVTLALCLTNNINIKNILPYFTFQLIGALLASWTLRYLFPLSKQLGGTLPAVNLVSTFLLETVMTTILVFLILFCVKINTKHFYTAILVGVIIFLEAYFGGPLTGASMNPVRSIGPSLITSHISYLWLYITAPIFGSLIAIIISKQIYITIK